jgi:NAD(P)-dependent dehydrogenase (short-subunit alcohol dehydrogenase family)
LNPRTRRWNTKVFITGATGYIGGSVAERFLTAGHEVFGLVRSKEKPPLLKGRGIDPVVGTLDNWRVLSDAAQSSDAVIHAASADDAGSVLTLVGPLERTGKPLIYTTGSGIVADSANGEYPAKGGGENKDDFSFRPRWVPRTV